MGKDATTEEKILAAARKVFVKKGMDGARMQDIADEAGINKALLHYYFRNKEKLFEKIFIEVAGAFIPKVENILNSDKPVFDKINSFCNEYISQMMETPFVPIFVLNEVNKQPAAFLKKVLGGRKISVDVFLRQIESEIKAGIIKPFQPVDLLLNIVSLCLFPFAARPMLQIITGIDPSGFTALMEKRKKEVPKLIIDYIKK